MNSLVRFWLCLLLLSLAGCAQKKEGETGTAPASQKSFTIAVIPKGTTHEFWKSINAGAVKAQQELDGQGLQSRCDLERSACARMIGINRFRSWKISSTRRVSGIVLAPLDSQALVNPVAQRRPGQGPGRHHRLGSEVRRIRQLRRDGQLQRRPAGRRSYGPSCWTAKATSSCSATPSAPPARKRAKLVFWMP